MTAITEEGGRTKVAPLTFAYLLFAASFLFLPFLISVWTVEADGVNSITRNLSVWDYVNLWSGGRLAAEGNLATLFDPTSFAAWQREMFSPRLEPHEWSYPPTLLLLAVPLAILPLYWSYAVFTAGSLLLLAWAMISVGTGRLATVLAVTSPAVIFNMLYGQNGALTAAALVGSLGLMQRRPVIAGILMGLLSIKPHLGILLLFCVIGSRCWKTLSSAIITSMLLLMASIAQFGVESWTLFLTMTQPMMQQILEAPWPQGYQVNAITVFMMFRAFGVGVALSYAIQGIVTATAAMLAWHLWRRQDVAQPIRVAMTIALTFLATPYAWAYDLVSMGAGIVLVAAHARWRTDLILFVGWLFPACTQILTRAFGLPIGPLVIVVLVLTFWKARHAVHVPNIKH